MDNCIDRAGYHANSGRIGTGYIQQEQAELHTGIGPLNHYIMDPSQTNPGMGGLGYRTQQTGLHAGVGQPVNPHHPATESSLTGGGIVLGIILGVATIVTVASAAARFARRHLGNDNDTLSERYLSDMRRRADMGDLDRLSRSGHQMSDFLD